MRKMLSITNRVVISLAVFFCILSASTLPVAAADPVSTGDATEIISGDYTLRTSSSLPQGSTIQIQNVDSVETVQKMIQSQISADQTAVVYFAYDISIVQENGEIYQPEEPVSITVTGPVVRGDISGKLALYSGDDESQLKESSADILTADKLVFSFNGHAAVAVADLTDSVEHEAVNPHAQNDVLPQLDSAPDEPIVYAQQDQSTASKYINPYLPALRNQGNYGLCWSYAAVALAELSAISNSSDPAALASTIDLSELQVAYFALNGVSGWENAGSDVYSTGLRMMDWMGPATESDVPYSNIENVIASGLDSSYEYGRDAYHVQNVFKFICASDSGRAQVKKYVSQNGGASISYYTSSKAPFEYYSSANNAYYCTEGYMPNHSVTIVGWDDNFSASNFNYSSSIPEGNGAWLVRNSWGGSASTDYCYQGYFWLSYYDQSISMTAVSMTVEAADNYDHNYDYNSSNDVLTGAYIANSKSAVGFTFKAGLNPNKLESIKAVSGGYYAANRAVKVEVYTDLTNTKDPSSGTLVDTEYSLSIYSSTAGHGRLTIPFKNNILIRDGTNVGIVVYISNIDQTLHDLMGFAENNTDIGAAIYTSNTEPSKMSMYRLYNPNSGEHFYTASSYEKDSLTKAGWIYEGIGWTAFNCSSSPVYRLYNPNAGDHHYTVNWNEKEALVAAGWKYEGIGWYSDDAKGIPLYRQYNKNASAGAHNYTANANERDMLIRAGWNDEGISWYGAN